MSASEYLDKDWHYEEATFFYKKLIGLGDINIYDREEMDKQTTKALYYLDAFLTSYVSIFYKLKAEYQNKAGFNDWFDKKVAKVRTDKKGREHLKFIDSDIEQIVKGRHTVIHNLDLFLNNVSVVNNRGKNYMAITFMDDEAVDIKDRCWVALEKAKAVITECETTFAKN